jgi:hypothetical protein
MTGWPAAIVDCFGVLEDAKIRRYFEMGCEVKGLGCAHVKRIKDEVKKMAKMNGGGKRFTAIDPCSLERRNSF